MLRLNVIEAVSFSVRHISLNMEFRLSVYSHRQATGFSWALIYLLRFLSKDIHHILSAAFSIGSAGRSLFIIISSSNLTLLNTYTNHPGEIEENKRCQREDEICVYILEMCSEIEAATKLQVRLMRWPPLTHSCSAILFLLPRTSIEALTSSSQFQTGRAFPYWSLHYKQA